MDHSTDIGLDPEDLGLLRLEAFERLRGLLTGFVELERLGQVVVVIDADKGRHVPAWDRVASAYHALRELWAPTPGRRRIRTKARPKGDPIVRARIMRWCQGIGDFRRTFYSEGAPEEVRSVVLLYRAKWSKWHKQSERYKARHKAYMRKYMADRRAAAKAAK